MKTVGAWLGMLVLAAARALGHAAKTVVPVQLGGR
jgi:hypothetical protein